MNRWMISGTIIIVVGIMLGVTYFKVITIHNNKLLLVESKYIIEASKRCLNEKKCNEDKITLKTLYDLDYLDRQVNLVTKEYYDENSYVINNNGVYEFVAL